MKIISITTITALAITLLSGCATNTHRAQQTEIYPEGLDECTRLASVAELTMYGRQHRKSKNSLIRNTKNSKLDPAMKKTLLRIIDVAWNAPVKSTEIGRLSSQRAMRESVYELCVSGRL